MPQFSALSSLALCTVRDDCHFDRSSILVGPQANHSCDADYPHTGTLGAFLPFDKGLASIQNGVPLNIEVSGH